jgi:hypothetical protein
LFVDPVYGRCVMDGYVGARIDLSAAPSVDIANGAPAGQDATDAIVDAWSDGRLGLNNEKTLVSWSTDGGASWAAPTVASLPGDRSMYSAPAISPDGSRVSVIYEGPTAPWQGADMTSPRPYHGVFRSAAFGAGGPSGWATLYDEPLGDLRGTFPGHDIYQERVGDYVYAAASRTYGVGVWTDARDAAVCPAVQQYGRHHWPRGRWRCRHRGRWLTARRPSAIPISGRHHRVAAANLAGRAADASFLPG